MCLTILSWLFRVSSDLPSGARTNNKLKRKKADESGDGMRKVKESGGQSLRDLVKPEIMGPTPELWPVKRWSGVSKKRQLRLKRVFPSQVQEWTYVRKWGHVSRNTSKSTAYVRFTDSGEAGITNYFYMIMKSKTYVFNWYQLQAVNASKRNQNLVCILPQQ